MATKLTPEKMKQLVRDHFEDFVNRRKASSILRTSRLLKNYS